MDDDGKVGSFDDLFEPFELEDAPPPGEEPPPLQSEGTYVACPSCGTRNPAHNRHCESCGARVAQGPLPVAPQPMLRTTPGARALGILAGVILVVALLALIVNFLRDSGDEAATDDTSDAAATTVAATAPVIAIEELTPTSVQASSELPGFEASHLIDSDPSNSWNDASLRGAGATLSFFFPQPVQISQIVIQNLDDEERFLRNYRIRGVEITVDDLTTTIIRELEDTRARQTIDIGSLETLQVTITITSTYEAQAFGTSPPFEELALQEVKFFGRLSPTATDG